MLDQDLCQLTLAFVDPQVTKWYARFFSWHSSDEFRMPIIHGGRFSKDFGAKLLYKALSLFICTPQVIIRISVSISFQFQRVEKGPPGRFPGVQASGRLSKSQNAWFWGFFMLKIIFLPDVSNKSAGATSPLSNQTWRRRVGTAKRCVMGWRKHAFSNISFSKKLEVLQPKSASENITLKGGTHPPLQKKCVELSAGPHPWGGASLDLSHHVRIQSISTSMIHSQRWFRFTDSLSLRDFLGFLHFLAQGDQAGLSNRLIAHVAATIQKFGNFQDSAWNWDSFGCQNKTYPSRIGGDDKPWSYWKMNVQVGYLVLTPESGTKFGVSPLRFWACLGHPAARYFANGAAIGGSTDMCTNADFCPNPSDGRSALPLLIGILMLPLYLQTIQNHSTIQRVQHLLKLSMEYNET